jgi:hypothetical protein
MTVYDKQCTSFDAHTNTTLHCDGEDRANATVGMLVFSEKTGPTMLSEVGARWGNPLGCIAVCIGVRPANDGASEHPGDARR